MSHIRFIVFIYILAFFLLGGCLNNQEENVVIPENTSQVLVESEMEVMVSECLVCHGTKEAQRGPILNGMDYWYLSEQLQKFHAGVRGQNPENRSEYLMGVGIRKVKTQVEIAYLANWFANQETKSAIRTIRGDVVQGKKLYQQRCAQCHGEHAEGNRKLQSPSLDKLEGWYFIEQMRKFRSVDRGYHAKDEWGKVMASASKDLSDWDLKNMIAYVIDEFGLPEAFPSQESTIPARSTKPF